MKITFDIKFLLIAIASFAVAAMTITSTIDNYIHFAGEANAAAFFLVALMMGVLSGVCSVDTIKIGRYTLVGKK
tara:strand:+ start:689 stop:910 length:222 start_codon:yes stop_codon:yes gene_type:complete